MEIIPAVSRNLRLVCCQCWKWTETVCRAGCAWDVRALNSWVFACVWHSSQIEDVSSVPYESVVPYPTHWTRVTDEVLDWNETLVSYEIFKYHVIIEIYNLLTDTTSLHLLQLALHRLSLIFLKQAVLFRTNLNFCILKYFLSH